MPVGDQSSTVVQVKNTKYLLQLKQKYSLAKIGICHVMNLIFEYT